MNWDENRFAALEVRITELENLVRRIERNTADLEKQVIEVMRENNQSIRENNVLISGGTLPNENAWGWCERHAYRFLYADGCQYCLRQLREPQGLAAMQRKRGGCGSFVCGKMEEHEPESDGCSLKGNR